MKAKVLITASKKTGGVKTFALALSSLLSELGYQCVLVESFKELLSWKALRELRQPNVVLVSSLGFGVFNLFARRSVFVLHGFPRLDDAGFFGFAKVGMATKLFASWATRVTSISQLTYLANLAFFGIRSDRIIGNPYLESNVPNSAPVADNEIHRVVYAGRLVKVKRVEQVIRGFLLAAEQMPNLYLEVVGSGPEESRLRQLANHPRITFAGSVSNQAAVEKMQRSNIFISLAEGENFGITFLEALSAGCHIVCPTTGGHLDWIMDYPQVTYVKNVFDPHDVCAAILKAVEASRLPKKPLDPGWNKRVALRYDELIREVLDEKMGLPT